MSYYNPRSYFVDSASERVAPGQNIQSEGLALVRKAGTQADGVRIASGAADEVFVGFSVATTSGAAFLEAFSLKQEKLTVPSTGIVTLERTPVAGQVGIWSVTDNAAIPVAAPVVVTGNQIAGLTAGDEIEVTYKFSLTVLEARMKYGDVVPGGYVGNYLGQIGVGKRGTIFTDNINAAADWRAARGVKLAAGGQLTPTAADGSEDDIAIKAVIKALPTQDLPFLGLEFSAV